MPKTSENWEFNGAVTINGTASFPSGTVDNNAVSANAAIARSKLAQDVLAVYPIDLNNLRVHDNLASLLPNTAATDDLAIVAGTLGTNSPRIRTGDLKAAGATTRYARFHVILPAEYDTAETVQIRVSAGMLTTISDGTATIDFEVYKLDRVGGVGSDICATAAQSINSLTFADKDFTITATSLDAGDILDVRMAIAINDTATGTAVEGAVGAIELLCDVRG